MKSKGVISLFSGGGGLDCGLMKSGLDILASQEFDASASETLRANGLYVIEGDIRKLIRKDPSCSFLSPSRPLAVVGGPPCQSFSSTGKRLGLKDERGRLFKSFVKVVAAWRPQFFVMENVASLGGAKYAPVRERILGSFQTLGYTVNFRILNAADFGAPQVRKRIIIMGRRGKGPIVFPVPTHAGKHRTFADALRGLKDNGEGTQFSEKVLRLMRLVPEGGCWQDLPSELQQEAIGHPKTTMGMTGIMRRVSFSKPLPTLMAGGPKQRLTTLGHPVEDRPLTLAEYARGQGFPDTWKFVGKVGSRYRQIGNAVPIALGEAIGKALIAMGRGHSLQAA